MIFKFAENRCILAILKILEKGRSRYSIMFKKTKFSHSTLQLVLNDLIKGKFIKKHEESKLNTGYEITKKGKLLLTKLEELKEILK